MHAKYEVSASNGSKVIANVKVDNRQTNKQTDKQTGQKQYAPDHSIRGHKNMYNKRTLGRIFVYHIFFFYPRNHESAIKS